MTNIFVFSQHLKINSLKEYEKFSSDSETTVFLTPHFLFANEREYLSSVFKNCVFLKFADFLTDEEMGSCDLQAYTSPDMEYTDYLANIKRLKNDAVIRKLLATYPDSGRYIFSDDLGIDLEEWVKNGFKQLSGDYYYKEEHVPQKKAGKGLKTVLKAVRSRAAQFEGLKNLYHLIKGERIYEPEDVQVGYFEGRKYVFIGNMNRIGYRLSIPFVKSEEECDRLNAGKYETKENCTYMTTWHEHGKCRVPDSSKYAVRWAQDGYLPPNYTHQDYSFKPKHVIYYCWDELGTHLFKNQSLPYEMIPFRKRLYLPQPVFPEKVTNVLVVASGSGDWTALKNRSDDDLMVEAFVEMARRFPQIQFTYRCHPTWVHPTNVGVNSINRVNEYFVYSGLKNITLSSNIPIAQEEGKLQYSFSRSSLAEDMANADFVFGEHSIAMIDAAFEKIPFSSVNLTKRRNFYIGINELGFPVCESYDEIAKMIGKITDEDFRKEYLTAVDNYNRMTDIDF